MKERVLTFLVFCGMAFAQANAQTCKIGETIYNNLYGAVQDVRPNEETTITMIADEEWECFVSIANQQHITLDLNSKSLNMFCLCVDGDSFLKIKDTGGNGRFTSSPYFCDVVRNYGTTVIEGGNFDGDGEYALINNYGNLTITGGTFTHHGTDSQSNQWDNRRVLWTSDGSYTVIRGGVFTCGGSSHVLCFNGSANIYDAEVASINKDKGTSLGAYSYATVNIYGGHFASCANTNCGMEANADSHVNVYGGNFEYTGTGQMLWYVGSHLDIYGGSFYSTGQYGCVYPSPNSMNNNLTGVVLILDGRFKSTRAVTLAGYNNFVHAFGGLFSHITNGYADSYHGLRYKNEDPDTKADYPIGIKPLPSVHKGRVWLRNVKTGRYLGVGDGSMWHTQMITTTDGSCLDMMEVAGGEYVSFVSKISNGSSWWSDDGTTLYGAAYSFVGYGTEAAHGITHLWSDRPNKQGLFVKHEIRPGVYSLELVGKQYMGERDGVVYDDFADDTDEATHWEFVTYDQIHSQLGDATLDHEVDATQLLGNPCMLPVYNRFSTAEANLFGEGYGQPWQERTGQALSNVMTTYANSNNYQWHYGSVTAKKFDVYQTVTDLPNGIYKVSCQGFHRNASTAGTAATRRNTGKELLTVMLYANDREVPLKSILEEGTPTSIVGGSIKASTYGYVPNAASAVIAYFDKNKYINELLVEVTDGTLTFGVKQQEKVISGEWTVFDRFRLTYYGHDASLEEVATGIVQPLSTVEVPDAWYSISGQKLEAEPTQPGIYIHGGRKVLKK